MTTETKTPIHRDAFQPHSNIERFHNIAHWWCPDCDIEGDDSTVDFISHTRRDNDDDALVTYCCTECFEENIYILLDREEA